MEYRRIETADDIPDGLRELYESSFPETERVPLVSLLSGPEGTHASLVSVTDGSDIVGMYSVIRDRDMTFLFYLAVSEKDRCRGIGSRILEHIVSHDPNPVVLNIELTADGLPPTDGRVRRMGFYLRNGFTDTRRVLHDEQGSFNILSNGTFDEQRYIGLMDSLGEGLCTITASGSEMKG
ncbi:MAG: GNAT family N-acetyltransferase [Candidatus Methanomethylophilaceae archaeon]